MSKTPLLRPRLAPWFAFALACLVASPVAAQEQPAAAPKAFESSAGLKLLVGGNLWTAPSDGPVDATGQKSEGLGFVKEGGGFGWGVAAYYEARFIQHLGLELDVGYDHSVLQRNVTYNGVVDTTEKVTMSGLRWGLLAKGIMPAPFGRMWLGLGPEFVSGSSTDASIEVKSDLVANKAAIERLISAKSKSSTMLTFAAGLAIHVGDRFEIPVDLRAAKNLSQESKWADRVQYNYATNEYRVTAQSSWDFRLAAGFGYRF